MNDQSYQIDFNLSNNIPQDLKNVNFWVCWRYEIRNGKPTKIPINPKTGEYASVSNWETWGTFNEAMQAAWNNQHTGLVNGVGIVLSEYDEFSAIDFDEVDDDELKAFQNDVFTRIDSYSELSPSGKGCHIILKGKTPYSVKKQHIEIYSEKRFITITGNTVCNRFAINNQDVLLKSLVNFLKPENEQILTMDSQPQTISDFELCRLAYHAANGQKFYDLYHGHYEKYYASQSEADLSLVNILAFYSKNHEQVIRVFHDSALGKRDKAHRQDYINMLIRKAYDNQININYDVLQTKIENKINETNSNKQIAYEFRQNLTEWEKELEKDNSQPEPVKRFNRDKYPKGLIGDIAEFIYYQSPRPVEELAFAAALGLFSGICGRAYNVSATGLNMYTLALASTGAGKEGLSSGIDKLIDSVSQIVPLAKEFIGASEIASSAAALKFMASGRNSFVSIVGEFGLKLQQMADQRAPAHLLSLRAFMLDVYNKSGKGKVLRPSIYSTAEKNTGEVKSPAFSLLGESTPEKFYEGLHEGLICEGLLPRFLIVEYQGKRPAFNEDHYKVQVSEDLKQRFANLLTQALMLNNTDNVTDVDYQDDAKDLFNKFNTYCDRMINESNKEVLKHLWNRAHLKALKIAALCACGQNQYKPVICKADAEFAINLVIEDCKKIILRFEGGLIGKQSYSGANNVEKEFIVKGIVKEFLTCEWEDLPKWLQKDSYLDLHKAKLIPFEYVYNKIRKTKVFETDRNGANKALKDTMQTFIDSGIVTLMSKTDAIVKYRTNMQVYIVTNIDYFIDD